MQYCVYCGEPIEDGARFCTACGTEQVSAQQPRVPRPAPKAVPVDDSWDEMPPPAPKKSSNTPLIIIVALLALLLIGGCVWFFLLRDKGGDASGEPEPTAQSDAAEDAAPEAGAAATVAFDHRYESGVEYGVITGADASGKAIWTVETPHYGVSQCARVDGLEIRNDLYYYIDDGDVVTLSLTDGREVWRNSDYGGSLGGWAFDGNGSVYLCGYEGPDLIVIDRQGATYQRYATFREDYYWPYRLQIVDDRTVIITYEMGPNESEGTLTVNPLSGEVVSAAGAQDTPPSASIAGAAATASSTLQEAGFDHSPRLVLDGNTATAWVEGTAGNGVSEWLRLDLGSSRTLSAVEIWSGYQKTENLFYKNCRPAAIRITFSDGSSVETTLADQMGKQTVTLSPAVRTSTVTITILSVYAGSTYSDTCISEIALS